MRLFSRTLPFLLVIGLATAQAQALAQTQAPPPAPADDKTRALHDFMDVYGVQQVWPQLTPKVARDSIPRLREAAMHDIEADKLPDAGARDRARARLDALMPAAHARLETALRTIDTDELAAVTAYEVYAKFFETEEIKQLTAFFGSPTGRKLTALGPTITRESKHPGAQDAMARHFSAPELEEIADFSASPAGRKLHDTAMDVRDAMHEQFMRLSEPAVQRLARELADNAEGGASPAPAAAPPASASASSAQAMPNAALAPAPAASGTTH